MSAQPQILVTKPEPGAPEDLEALFTKLRHARADVSVINEQLKAAKEVATMLEQEALARLDLLGIDQAKAGGISVSKSSEVVPTVHDWDAFFKYVHDNEAYHLLQKRAAAGAYRELRATGEEVPGCQDFSKTKLSVKKS